MRHLQSFRYLKAIIDAGSIRGATETLAISPSALNRHIQTLELDLDIKLFDRLSRGVRLSPEGEIFYDFALRQLAEYDRVQHQISNVKGLARGSLKLGLSQDLSLAGVQQLICDFQREHNKIDIEVQVLGEAELQNRLLEGSLDLALAVNPTLRRGLKALHAGSIEFAAFVHHGIGLGGAEKLRIYDVQGCHLALPPAETALATRVVSACERLKILFHRSYSGPDLLGHLEKTPLATVGIIALPLDADRSLSVPGYKRLHLEERDMGSCTLCLLSAEQRGLSRAAHKCQELLSELFQ